MRTKGVVFVTVIFFAAILSCLVASDGLCGYAGEHSPFMAYNPTTQRYFFGYQWYQMEGFLWENFVTPFGSLGPSRSPGGFIGWQTGSYVAEDRSRPSIAYDSVNDRFLLVWTGLWPSNDLYGIILDRYGAPYPDYQSAQQFLISSAADAQIDPKVIYDDVNQRFLVVWKDYRDSTGTTIYGQLINTEGLLYGSEFLIENVPDNDSPRYDVAHDDINQRFLVILNSVEYTGNTYGKLIDATGNPVGEKFLVMEGYGSREVSVAYDWMNQRYLAVIQDYGVGIHGQLLYFDGTFLGTNFLISHGYNASVAYDSVNQRYLVAWHGEPGGGIFLNPDGMPQGQEYSFPAKNGYYYPVEQPPTIAFNPQCGNFLVAVEYWKPFQELVVVHSIDTMIVGDPCPGATLTVKKKGYRAAKSSVTAQGLECKKNKCINQYIRGSAVSITAYPDSETVLGSWTGCDTVTDNVCNVTMEGDREVTAKLVRVPKKSR